MPRFLRIYDYKAAGTFRGGPLKLANGWMLAGTLDGNGLIAFIGFDGNPVWQKKYAAAGKKISFNGLLRTDAKIFAYGVIHISDRRADHLLVQIDPNGNLINWANLASPKPAMALYSDFSRYNIDLTELSSNRILVTGWHNPAGSNDHTELFCVNLLEGGMTTAAKFYVNYDTQVYHTSNIPNDPARPFAYISGSAQVGSVKGLFAVVGYKNTFADTRTAHLLAAANASLTQLFCSHPLPGKAHLIAGTFTKANQAGDTLFLAKITTDDENPNPGIVVNKAIGLQFGGETRRVTGITKFGDKWLVTGFLTASVTSFAIGLDSNLNVEWVKALQTGSKSVLTDAEVFDAATLALSGYVTGSDNLTAPALLYTDGQLASCKTEPLTWELVDNVVFQTETIKSMPNFELYPYDSSFIKRYFPDILVSNAETTPIPQCAEKEFIFSEGERMPQSPFLHAQAAGSLGVESTAGIHLRWTFLRELGDKHLPKGNYTAVKVNFNKPDDFVHLYRIPYLSKAPVNFPLTTQSPVFKDHAQARWRYVVPGLGNVDVWFRNKTKYDSLNSTGIAAFWTAYKGDIVEIELKETLAFAVEIGFTATGNYNLEAETLGAEANHPLTSKTVTARQRYTQALAAPYRILSENMRCVRCRWDNGNLTNLAFEPYDAQLFMAAQNRLIEYIGAFSLSQDDKTAFARLEDKPRTTVHGLWKKYNEDAFVNTANYQKRWSKTGGLKHGIGRYLALSNDVANPTASEQVADYPDVVAGGKTVTVNYLDLLQIAATDFHVARMLGMGHLDTPPGNADAAYLYLAEYHTGADLKDGQGARPVQHLYMSLPTARKDQRFPEEVMVKNITYGLNDQSQVALTDENGYTPDGMNRYINVFAALKNSPVQGNNFFVPNNLFQASDVTNPVFVGMEYRKVLTQRTDWQKPEIAHHTETTDPDNPQSPKLYQDTKGIAETAVLLFEEDGSRPSLLHRETDPGVHQYAAYPINIFSRSGVPLSAPVNTDETRFTKRNTLMPPSDVRVQLIQREDPMILTSQNEQAMLDKLTGSDKTLLRLTFNYTHIQDANYDCGDRFEVFFRQEMPRQVTGGIGSVNPDPANSKQSEVMGVDYTFTSNGQLNKPVIADRQAYIGGSFVHDGRRFEIKNLADAGGNYPKFTVQHAEERTVITNGMQQTITVGHVGPKDPDKKPFMAIENMANAANWGAGGALSYKIDVDDSQWSTRQEVMGEVVAQVRGIWGKAKIEFVDKTYTWKDDQGIIQSKTEKDAYCKITFDTFGLKRHKQFATSGQHTSWCNGVVRVPSFKGGMLSGTTEWIALPVFKIEQQYDANEQPVGPLVLYAGDDTLNRIDFQLNTFMEVNFYPGYRTYLLADAAKGFDAAAILPNKGGGHKNTLIGLRTMDVQNSYTSPVGIPAVLMAQEQVAPVAIKMPKGPEYATPPDIYNKSTYTFSLEADAEPFAVAFYRTDINAVLNALYKPQTVNQIKAELEKRPIDQHWAGRWQNLMHSSDPLQLFGNYQFPVPNKLPPDATKPDMVEAIRALFVPITTQPLLLRDIQANPMISQRLPAVWDAASKQLTFTDFTLDGGMNTAFFYFARNISMRMEMDEPSPVLGPVQLVNTRPPAAITLSKVLTKLPDVATAQSAAIQFEFLAPGSSEKVSKIRIYRAGNSADALHLRSMAALPNDIKLSSLIPVDGVFTILDDFNGAETPYGDPLYYRLVGLREVRYKDLNGTLVMEDILSAPSKMILANVVDTVNPKPPKADYSSLSTTWDLLSNVEIFWDKTTYKGRYLLFKLADSGQWKKIKTIDNQNNDLVIRVKLADTDLANGDLPLKDTNGNKIYHHFKVGVESTSGLLNLYDEVLTIGP